MYLVTFSKLASKDKKLLKNVGLDKKAKELLILISNEPLKSPPPYEKLTGNLIGYYSRRINIQHRLVYRIDENTDGRTDSDGKKYDGIVYVKRMWTHYDM